MRRPIVIVALFAICAVVASTTMPSAGATIAVHKGSVSGTDDHGVTYRPPVDAPVTDPFRAPLTPYGSGNRGIEYATAPGSAVQAAADGIVVFAGPVAGGLHVTVLHRDGIRTSYSFLAAIRSREGQNVRGGDEVGLAAAMLHVGARRGDTYIDPASLWGQHVGPPVVHLVPLDGYEPDQRQRQASGAAGPEPGAPTASVAEELTALGVGVMQGAVAGVGVRPP